MDFVPTHVRDPFMGFCRFQQFHPPVGVRILREEHQLYPTNPDNDLKADGRAIIFDDHEEVTDEPYYLKIRAYSPTANYEHVVYVRIGILPSEVVVPFSGLGGALRKFLGYVGVMK